MTDTPTATTEHTLTDIEMGHIHTLNEMIGTLLLSINLWNLEAEKHRLLKNEAAEKQAYANSDTLHEQLNTVRWAIRKLEQP